MFCTYCKQTRVENETPCPHCGAPSPLLQASGISQWGTNNSTGAWTGARLGLSNNLQTNSWGGPATYGAGPQQAAGAQWEQAATNQPMQQQSPSFLQPMEAQARWEAPISQLGFDKATAPSPPNAGWPQMSPATSSQTMSVRPDNGTERQATSQALLPMVYQEPQVNEMRQSTVSLQLIPEHTINHLLPEIAETPESVYVPPLYTKPRPLIPRYRIISGTLSVLIVVLLLCGGVGYYAKVSGTIDRVFHQFTGQRLTAGATPTFVALADPPHKTDMGPAAKFIPSGTTTLRIDQANNVALETDQVFTVNQPFYVTYTLQLPQGEEGRVTVKWYMNGQFYRPITSDLIKGSTTKNGSLQMQYTQAAEGTVEIWWKDQMAERFYFVVRPAAN